MAKAAKPLDSEKEKKGILEKLENARDAGVSEGKILTGAIKKNPEKLALYKLVIRNLQSENIVTTHLIGKYTYYFLNKYAPSAETISKGLDIKLSKIDAELFEIKELKGLCAKHEQGFVEDAVEGLVLSGSLIKFIKGKKVFYLHTEALRRMLGAEKPIDKVSINPKQIWDAFKRLSTWKRSSWIEIYALCKEANCDLEGLKKFILDEAHAGRANVEVGEPSLLSNAERDASVIINGKSFYLVSFL